MKKGARVLLCVLIIVATLLILFLAGRNPVYETNDIHDYGIVKGNYDNDTPKEFVFSFFPVRIEDHFNDVQYHYKAIKGDTYAYEMSLEFTIVDKQQYSELKAKTTNNTACKQFEYAPEYQVFCVDDLLKIGGREKNDRITAPIIHQAQIGLVLFSDSEQRIVYVAMGVYDGGGVTTDDLNCFFDRFHVNPWSYGELLARRQGTVLCLVSCPSIMIFK